MLVLGGEEEYLKERATSILPAIWPDRRQKRFRGQRSCRQWSVLVK